MNLERLAVELRPRTPWEAVDLGATLVHAWWRPLYAAWLALLLPAAVAALVFLGGWGLLLLWWLKPLFDRVALFVLSRAVFGDAPRTRTSLRELPRLLRGYLFDALVLYRLDPARSFHLATWQLEGLRGSRRRQRASVLDSDASGVAGLLTLTSLSFELGGGLALLALAPMLTPDWTGVDWGHVFELWLAGEGPAWFRTLVLAAPVLAFALLEPFYVAAGFALYLNRRTQLEGWDLEIAFRRLADRARQAEEARRAVERRARTRRAAGGLALLMTALLLGLMGSQPTSAQDSPSDEEDAEPSEEPRLSWQGSPERDPRRLAEAVLAEPEFEREVTEEHWQLRDDLFDDEDETSFGLGWLSTLLGWFGAVALWGLAIALFLWLIVRGLMAMGWVRLPQREGAPGPPRTVAGLDIRPESLPDDPARAAEEAWRAGRHAEALSLLYRASLATLVNRDGVPLRESDTEDDCLEAARGHVATDSCAYLQRLTRGWLSTAYAHRPPGDEDALPLFRDWTGHFGRAA